MLRLLLLFSLLFSFSAIAADSTKTLQRADRFLKSGNKSEIFRAYNDYKNLYLTAVINNDEGLRQRSLEGIVSSGKRLHIDVAKYDKELSTSSPKSKPLPKKSIKKKEIKKKVTVSKRYMLRSINWKDGRLILRLNKSLPSKLLNYFKLYDKKRKKYRYVFDMHDTQLDKHYKLHHANIQRISLAQFRPNTLRLVIEHDKALKIRFKLDRNALIINPGVKKPVEKTRPVRKVTAPVVHDRMMAKTIVLDPGHGGRDGGAVGYRKYREKMVVLQISREVSKLLKKAGHKVYMTRSDDSAVKLQKRTQFANIKKADIFISIHANAVPKRNAHKVSGIETYFLSNNTDSGSERAKRVAKMENSQDLKDVNFYGQTDFINILNREKIKRSERLAHDLQRNILATLNKSYKGVKDTGVREGPFWVLVGAQMPAVLIEVGFITHPTEALRLGKSAYQRKMAEGIVQGIEQYFLKNP